MIIFMYNLSNLVIVFYFCLNVAYPKKIIYFILLVDTYLERTLIYICINDVLEF